MKAIASPLGGLAFALVLLSPLPVPAATPVAEIDVRHGSATTNLVWNGSDGAVGKWRETGPVTGVGFALAHRFIEEASVGVRAAGWLARDTLIVSEERDYRIKADLPHGGSLSAFLRFHPAPSVSVTAGLGVATASLAVYTEHPDGTYFESDTSTLGFVHGWWLEWFPHRRVGLRAGAEYTPYQRFRWEDGSTLEATRFDTHLGVVYRLR